jgi:hypothetical protein
MTNQNLNAHFKVVQELKSNVNEENDCFTGCRRPAWRN